MSSISNAIEALNDFIVYLERDGIYPKMVIAMDDEALERLCYKISGEYRFIGVQENGLSLNPLTIATATGPVRFISKKSLQSATSK